MSTGPVRVVDVGDASVVELDGEIDAALAPGLAARLSEMVEGAAAVVIDLTGVVFMDSSGVRLVDHLARSCAGRDVPWRMVAPRGSAARRVLELVEMVGPEVSEYRADALLAVRPGR